jgi:hypothetical protein
MSPGFAALPRSGQVRRGPGLFRLEAMDSINRIFGNAITVLDGTVTVKDEAALASDRMDKLVHAAVFGSQDERQYARWLVWEIGQAVGVRAASIHDLYMARGRGEIGGFTVPAINVRGLSYHTGRSIFRTAIKLKAGAFILEIARSEIGYTEQRPAEYVTVMLAAALRERFRGPVFIQGDHFQVNSKKWKTDPRTEVDAVKMLVREAVAAGFYNIDIDTSTLVDLSKPSLEEQQRPNYEVGIDILRAVRATVESRSRVSRSSWTSAMLPSGRTTPPCDVPDWTLILDRPAIPFGRVLLNPSMKARNSGSVEFSVPTSPISPPAEIVTPFGSAARTARRMSMPTS